MKHKVDHDEVYQNTQTYTHTNTHIYICVLHGDHEYTNLLICLLICYKLKVLGEIKFGPSDEIHVVLILLLYFDHPNDSSLVMLQAIQY